MFPLPFLFYSIPICLCVFVRHSYTCIESRPFAFLYARKTVSDVFIRSHSFARHQKWTATVQRVYYYTRQHKINEKKTAAHLSRSTVYTPPSPSSSSSSSFFEKMFATIITIGHQQNMERICGKRNTLHSMKHAITRSVWVSVRVDWRIEKLLWLRDADAVDSATRTMNAALLLNRLNGQMAIFYDDKVRTDGRVGKSLSTIAELFTLWWESIWKNVVFIYLETSINIICRWSTTFFEINWIWFAIWNATTAPGIWCDWSLASSILSIPPYLN